MIIIHFQRHSVFIYDTIAKRFNITHGQRLTSQAQFSRVVKENATHHALLGQYQAEYSVN